MKPANFPGRKNDRRKGALARMPVPEKTSHAQHAEHPYYRLAAKIVPDAIARSIHTKKDRSARGILRK